MRLTRLRVAELRRFRDPFELSDIQPGLNIFTGANEAGKSTLVRAIRAAFFERHKSGSVEDLRPSGDSAATPLVEIDFEIAGLPCRLTKSFLQKKRCELVLGTRRLEGVEAEDALAERLGFQFALKGASREEHWGIPGLLWIEQGSAHALRDAVVNAADHLRKALDESLGEVSATGGDEVVAQVRKWRDELLTGTGKPKAGLLKAVAEAEELAQRAAALQQAVAAYQDQVDQLKLLRDAHAADAAALPWQALRAQQAGAQQALLAVQALAGTRDQAQERLRQASGLHELLAQRLAAAEQQRQDLLAREAAHAAAASRHEQAVALERQAAQADAAAAALAHAAREALALARQEHSRAVLARQAAEARARAAELASLLERAGAEGERAVSFKRDAALLRIEPRDLASLREQQSRLTELQIRQAVVATRLRFDLLPSAAVEMGAESISGQAERLLVSPTVVTVPGVGRLHIAPGGGDLAELAQAHSRLQDEHRALLQQLGLASLADAESRDRAHAQRQADADAADKARKLLAPKGLDALRADLDAARARDAEASTALARLPAPPAAPPSALASPAPTLDAAEHQHEGARGAAEQAARQLQSARQALATAASQLEAARQERDALRALLEDPQLQADLTAKRDALLAAAARESALRAEVAAIEARIAAARPEILKQDVQRYQSSAEQAENLHRARDRQIAQLEAALAAAGAQGLEEDLARTQSAHALAQRRAVELQDRADALDHLLQKLEKRRQALTRRLQAPLQKHLDRYLGLLFPSASLQVDEKLVPGALTRPGARGPEASDFETLSFGAREQMGVISRLAYADLLKEAGRPTLIILDDALVHSDEQRLARMKRVLFDAAQRHQVLLFTCHPGSWRDMGVQLRSLHALPAAAAGSGPS
jgi:energy-coupling factor transporter ATP-binding protein EcfA2